MTKRRPIHRACALAVIAILVLPNALVAQELRATTCLRCAVQKLSRSEFPVGITERAVVRGALANAAKVQSQQPAKKSSERHLGLLATLGGVAGAIIGFAAADDCQAGYTESPMCPVYVGLGAGIGVGAGLGIGLAVGR